MVIMFTRVSLFSKLLLLTVSCCFFLQQIQVGAFSFHNARHQRNIITPLAMQGLSKTASTYKPRSSSCTSTSTAATSTPAVASAATAKAAAAGLLLAVSSFLMPITAASAIEIQYKLPPIDYKDTNRCKLESSSMGQANAARDKLYDLRECDLKGQSGAGKDMSGLIAADADFSGVNFKEAQISKAYAKNGKFVGCDFTNAVADRVSFDGADLSKSVFRNAVLSGTVFTNANLKDTDFSDAYLGPFDLKNLCSNPTLSGKNPVTGEDSKESAGCLE